jgi:tetratricopeptide (TPR) repeat protein
VVAAVFAYLPALDAPFISDDQVYVSENSELRSLPLGQSWRVFVSRTNPYEYLPLRDLSYRVDMALFGLWRPGYRLHNLLLYAGCCLAVWLCVERILALAWERDGGGDSTAREWAATAATALFAVHPAHAESVAWIAGRKDLLSGLLGILALWRLTHFSTAKTRKIRDLVAAYLLFAGALLSKATIMPLPLLAALFPLGRWVAGKDRAGALRDAAAVAPLFLIAAAAFWHFRSVAEDMRILVPVFQDALLPLDEQIGLATRILGYLTSIALFPVRLRLHYDVDEPGAPAVFAYALGVATIVAGLAGCWFHARRRSAAGWGLAAFLLLCVPFLQLVPFRTWSLASERFVFLPVLGLALVFGVVLRRVEIRRRIPVLAGVAFVGIAITLLRCITWAQGPEALYANSVRLSPGHPRAVLSYVAGVLNPEHRFDEAEAVARAVRDPIPREMLLRIVVTRRALSEGRHGDAQREADRLANIVERHTDAEAHYLIALARDRAGDAFGAARHYTYVLEQPTAPAPQQADARKRLAAIRAQYAPRIEELKNAARTDPTDLAPRGALASLLMELFLLDEAEAILREVVAVAPDLAPAHYNLGIVLARQQRSREVVTEFEAAIAGGLNTATAWNNLGLAYKNLPDVVNARRAFSEALRADPKHWHAALNLGRMEIALGDRDLADEAFREARRRATDPYQQRYIDLHLERAD